MKTCAKCQVECENVGKNPDHPLELSLASVWHPAVLLLWLLALSIILMIIAVVTIVGGWGG